MTDSKTISVVKENDQFPQYFFWDKKLAEARVDELKAQYYATAMKSWSLELPSHIIVENDYTLLHSLPGDLVVQYTPPKGHGIHSRVDRIVWEPGTILTLPVEKLQLLQLDDFECYFESEPHKGHFRWHNICAVAMWKQPSLEAWWTWRQQWHGDSITVVDASVC